MSHDFAKSQNLRRESMRGRSQPPRRKSSGVPSWMWVLVGTLAGCLIMFLVYLSGVRPPLSVTAPTAITASSAPPHPNNAATTPTTEPPPESPKRVSPVFEFYSKLPAGGQPVTDIAPSATQPTLPATAVPPASTNASAPTNVTAPTNSASPSPVVNAPGGVAQPDVAPSPAPVPAHKVDDEVLDPIQQLLASKEKQKAVVASGKQDASAKTAAVSKSTSGSRYLQAGVFRNKVEAEKLRSKMMRLGVNTSIRTINGANGEPMQKVIAGPFRSAEEAEDAHTRLGNNSINTIPFK